MALRRVAGGGRGFALLAVPILILGLMGPSVSALGDNGLWLDEQSVQPGRGPHHSGPCVPSLCFILGKPGRQVQGVRTQRGEGCHTT